MDGGGSAVSSPLRCLTRAVGWPSSPLGLCFMLTCLRRP